MFAQLRWILGSLHFLARVLVLVRPAGAGAGAPGDCVPGGARRRAGALPGVLCSVFEYELGW